VPHRVTEVATIVALVTSGIGEGTLDGYRGRVPRPYDLVIIGLGSAGLTAARFASAELGLRVAAVERDRRAVRALGSLCVAGCTCVCASTATFVQGESAR